MGSTRKMIPLVVCLVISISLSACSGMGFGIPFDKIFGVQSFGDTKDLDDEDNEEGTNGEASQIAYIIEQCNTGKAPEM